MNIQLRCKDDYSKLIDDMPSDYLTNSMFAIGIIQSADMRELLYYYYYLIDVQKQHLGMTRTRI
jgi:hypothetical protein